jgi:hypothetical protein
METLAKFTLSGILFALALVFGFWLSHTGRPYNGPLFNIHKLIALGCVVLLGIQFSKTLHALDWQLVGLLTVLTLCVIALFASGSLMSAEQLDHGLMLTIHRVASMVLVAGLGFILLFVRLSA